MVVGEGCWQPAPLPLKKEASCLLCQDAHPVGTVPQLPLPTGHRRPEGSNSGCPVPQGVAGQGPSGPDKQLCLEPPNPRPAGADRNLDRLLRENWRSSGSLCWETLESCSALLIFSDLVCEVGQS